MIERTSAPPGVPARGSRPSTSLIISSRGRPAFLSDVVDSILAGEETPDEIVLIDQSTTVQSRLEAMSREAGSRVRYLWQPDRGLSRGRNRGLEEARGSLLIFVDDDVLVPREWFGTIVSAAVRAGQRSVITGRVVAGRPESSAAFAPSLSLSEAREVYRGRPGKDVLLPHNMALHRSAVDEIGGFDERLGVGSHFPSSEDNDFGYRLLEAGYEIIHDPQVVVVHRAWRRQAALLPLRWAYGRGQGAYFAKHFSLRDNYMLQRLWVDVWRHIRRAPRRAQRKPLDGLADVVYSWAVLAGAAEWLLRRMRR